MSNHYWPRILIIRLITVMGFLVIAPVLLAQPGITKGTLGKKVILRPQIKAVKTPQTTASGMAKLLPLQNFTIEGRFFHDLSSKNKIHVKVGATAWSPPMFIATIIPTSATTTVLTAQIPFIETNPGSGLRYFLAVEVEGRGISEVYRVEIGEMNITDAVATPHIKSISPVEAQQGDLVTLTGFFRGNPRVFFYPTTVGGSPFSLTPSDHTQKKITFKVPPELAAGGYKISVGAENSPGLTNPPVRFRVILNPNVKYVLEIDRIKCLKESADGPGSDEIYATAISFGVNTSSSGSFFLYRPVEAATQIYTDVDAGEYRQATVEIRKFDQAWGPVDYLILVGLHEYDGVDESNSVSPKSLLYGDGEKIMKGVERGENLFKTDPSSREQLVSRAKLVMLNEIILDSSPSGDEFLGLEELRITQTDMQKLKQLNGAPIMKQLIFKGDDSLYVVDFRFRMEK